MDPGSSRDADFLAAFYASSVGMCQCDPYDGRMLLVNPHYCKMLGYGAEELINRPFIDVTHPEDRATNLAGFLQLSRGEVPEYKVRKRFVRRDGEVLWADLTVNLVRSPGGRPLRTQAIIIDITARLAIEDERERLLVEYREAADRAERAQRELIASRERMARDLHAMTWLHTLATREVPDDEQPRLLEEIVEAAIAITGSDMGVLQVLDARSGLLHVAAQRSIGPTALEWLQSTALDERLPRAVALRTGERVVVGDAYDDPYLASLFKDLSRPSERQGRSFQITPIRSRAGAVIGLLSTAHVEPHTFDDGELRLIDLLARQSADVVERATQRRIVEELREDGRRKDEFLVAVADPVLIVRVDGHIEYANALAEKVFGYSIDELVGLPLETLIPERFRDRHAAHVGGYFCHPRTRAMGTGGAMELVARRKDGSEFPVDVSLGPIQTSAGPMVSTVVRDITERRRAETQARLNMMRLESAVEIVADVVAIWDAAGRLVTCNAAYRDLIEEGGATDRADMSYDQLWAWMPQHFALSEQGSVEAFLAERERNWSEPRDVWELTTADGRTLWFTRQHTPEHGVVLTGIDITADIVREEELERARAEAEAASRAKSEFLASMSHELRTPLNAVLGFAQLLQRDRRNELNEIQREMVGHIYSGGTHLLRLIDDILDLARIEASGVTISLEPTSVQDVLHDVLRKLQPAATANEVQLLEGAIADVPRIEVDRGRFVQILINFGSNAIKYNRKGGSVQFSVSMSTPHTVRVAVTDTGPGIPPERQQRLFQPFYRAGQETGAIEGSGIGLAISKRLAELMRGSVGFESTMGRGSVFWVDAPICALSAGAAGSGAPLPDVRLVVDRHRLILCVDDNPASVTLLKAMFAQIDNIELICATSAEEGVALARLHRPDVILMDIHLPGVTGMEALRLLRGWPETRDIPAIALTAAATRIDRLLGKQAGFEHYLVKPIGIEQLEIVLNDILNRSDNRSGRD